MENISWRITSTSTKFSLQQLSIVNSLVCRNENPLKLQTSILAPLSYTLCPSDKKPPCIRTKKSRPFHTKYRFLRSKCLLIDSPGKFISAICGNIRGDIPIGDVCWIYWKRHDEEQARYESRKTFVQCHPMRSKCAGVRFERSAVVQARSQARPKHKDLTIRLQRSNAKRKVVEKSRDRD